jgi:hypothetical protein
MSAGSKTGRGQGFCSGNGMPGAMNRENAQNHTVAQQLATVGCRGSQSCGTGIKKGNGHGNGCTSGTKSSQS